MYDVILVPVDGGDEGMAQSVAEALDLAAVTGAAVHALYVVDTRDYSTLSESKWVGVEDALHERGERALDEIEQKAAAREVPFVRATERGIPYEEILRYIDDHDVDAVVMATHGRTGVDRFFLGSVTEKVIHRSNVPVLVVRIRNDSHGTTTAT